MLKKILKYLVRVCPFALTKNEHYDRLTVKIIQRYCSPQDVCVDVGAHDGKILKAITSHCNKTIHYAFEPLPFLYKVLVRKFGSACHVYCVALGKEKGVRDFNYVRTSPAYSGLQKRELPQPQTNELIKVQLDLLDNFIPVNDKVKLIKIDVEGGELDVLEGAKQTINKSQPLILFEFGKGGSEAYGTTPPAMFSFFEGLGYSIYLLNSFLSKRPALSLLQFQQQYDRNREYFFIASPKNVTG